MARDLPFAAEKVLYELVWHERLHVHPAHQWFRSLVAEVCGPRHGPFLLRRLLVGAGSTPRFRRKSANA